MIKEALDAATDKMNKTVTVLKNDFKQIRAGRANPQILDRVFVDYYGTPTPVNQVGNVSVPEPRMLTITLWDPSMLTAVEKAIQASDIGINPSNDGKIIRLVFPELNEERRKDLTKKIAKMNEGSKVAIRSIRRDCIETIKKLKKDSLITEDEQKKAEEDAQKLTDKFIKTLDEVSAAKEKEIMEI
ncbi:MAG: ribosome recycling factor [Eubacteriales bacterium]|nr:ribosome recycling factor [Eubacteriales bacterium]